jgi:hypothetical protein
VLGLLGARGWVTRADDWSKPAYDGFDRATDWVPPFDPTLAGTVTDDASATYLRHARAAAEEATNAVRSAIEELLREQADGAALANAQRRAAGIAQLEQRALCGDAKPDCDTTIVHDADLSGYFPPVACAAGFLCTNAQLMRDLVVPQRAGLAKAVYDQRFAQSPPAFNEYAGGKLQGVLVEQWAALRKLQQLVAETAASVNSHQLQSAAAEAERAVAYAQLGQAYALRRYECGDEAKNQAYVAGFSYPANQRRWAGFGPMQTGRPQWSGGALVAQEQACTRAEMAVDPVNAQLASHAAKQDAIVGQAWSWLAAQTTLLLEAGAALQFSGANLAKGLQETKLAKAQAQLEASLALDNLQTKFGTYRRYHSYDVWRARGLLESTRRYAVAARRAIEARYVVDLSEMRSDEPFVAAPATWADEIYEYDLAAPASVGLTAIPTSGGGIYPNRLLDYVGNLERFVNGYAVARPTAIAQLDDELFHVPGPDARASGVLSGDVAGWEFRCPNGSWVQHPGLDAATPNAPIATICGGTSPARARVSFSLDPWGRLNGHIPDAPYAKRHNARWLELAVNFVGTGVRNCAIAADPNGCYSNAYLRYHLMHAGPAWVTNFDEQWRALAVPVGSIEGAKALTAEQWLDPTGNGFSKPYVASVARTELAGRPLGGTYRLELEVTPDVRLERIDRVQVLTRSTYWVKQGQSSPLPATSTPPTLTTLDHNLADTAGGDSITITGAGLTGALSCTVGGTPATITSNTDTSLTVTVPARPAGMHDVHVTTASGTSNALSIEAWDPSVLTGCTLLLDGRVGRADDGAGKLLSWTPRFGGYGAVTPSGGDATKRPVNGVPLDFDGYNDSLYMGNWISGGATEQSTFFVARTISANTTALSPYSVPEPVISSLYLGSLGFSGPNVAVYPSAYVGVTTFSAAYALNDGQAHLVGWAQEHPAADLITTVYADNQTLGSRNDAGAVLYSQWIQLGEGYDDGGGPGVTDYYDGDLHAVISYARKLTAVERTKLHNWSRVRHGVN